MRNAQVLDLLMKQCVALRHVSCSSIANALTGGAGRHLHCASILCSSKLGRSSSSAESDLW